MQGLKRELKNELIVNKGRGMIEEITTTVLVKCV